MPEFETVAALVREQFDEGCEPLGISPKIRRQLKQDRTRLFAQQRQSIFEQLEAVNGIVRQALPVRDEFGCFPGKHKIIAGLLAPASNGFWCRSPIEYAVEFGRR